MHLITPVNNNSSPIEIFFNGFFYYGDRQYKVLSKETKVLQEETSPQGAEKIALKIALLATGIIPLIALIYRGYVVIKWGVHRNSTIIKLSNAQKELPQPLKAEDPKTSEPQQDLLQPPRIKAPKTSEPERDLPQSLETKDPDGVLKKTELTNIELFQIYMFIKDKLNTWETKCNQGEFTQIHSKESTKLARTLHVFFSPAAGKNELHIMILDEELPPPLQSSWEVKTNAVDVISGQSFHHVRTNHDPKSKHELSILIRIFQNPNAKKYIAPPPLAIIQENFDPNKQSFTYLTPSREGSLTNRLALAHKKPLTREHKIQIMGTLLEALVVLEERGISHRNIHSDNILYWIEQPDNSIRIELINFENAKDKKDSDVDDIQSTGDVLHTIWAWDGTDNQSDLYYQLIQSMKTNALRRISAEEIREKFLELQKSGLH